MNKGHAAHINYIFFKKEMYSKPRSVVRGSVLDVEATSEAHSDSSVFVYACVYVSTYLQKLDSVHPDVAFCGRSVSSSSR